MDTKFDAWLKAKTGYSSAEIYDVIVKTGGYKEYRKIMDCYERQYRQIKLENENPFLAEAETSGKEIIYE